MKAKITKAKLGFLLAFILMLSFGNLAYAATVTWVGGTSVVWTLAGNWSPASAPADGDDVIIPGGTTFQPEIGAFGTNALRSLTLNGNATLTLNNAAAVLNVATAAAGGNGHVTLNGTSSITVTAVAATINIGSTTYRGDLILNGTGNVNLTLITGTTTISGTIEQNSTGIVSTDASTILTLVGTTAITLPDDITNLNNLTITKTGATVSLGATTTLAGALAVTSGIFDMSDYGLTVTGTSTVSTGASVTGTTTETVTRNFGTTASLDGTASLTSSGPLVTNTFTTLTLGASLPGAVVNLTNSTTTISTDITNLVAAATLNINGATFTYSGGACSLTGLTLSTNSNTALTISATGAITNFPAISELQSLRVTTAASVLNLTGNLTISGALTSDIAAGLVLGANTVTVNGTFTNTQAAAINATGTTLVLNGPAVFTVNITSTNTTSLTFGGTGAITGFPGAAATFNTLIYNRPGVNTTLSAHVLTITNAMTITSGTVTAAVDAQFIGVGTYTIGVNGTLDFAAFDNAFPATGTVTGTGTIDATGATELSFAGVYSFTGDLQTGTSTDLVFNTAASGDVELNSSVTNVGTLTYNRTGTTLTLNNDLTLANAVTTAEFVDGSIVANGYTLTIPGGSTAAGTWDGIDGRNSSTLVFTGAAVLANLLVVEDETTNLTFTAIPATFPATITECNNFTLSAAGTVVLLGAIDINGNLDVGAGCSFSKSTFNLTVYGNISNTGTMILDGNGGTITVYGSIEGEGAYTTDETTNLVVKGSGSQLVLPYTFGATAIGNLTVNRASGVKLNANLSMGVAGTTGLLTLTSGDLDLNGNVLTMVRAGAAASLIAETAGNTIINTGATGASNGYVTLTSTALTDIEPSGIGVILATSGGATTVRRYPITVPVPGVGLSTARYYYLDHTTAITALTLQYDQTELNSDASSLNLYVAANDAFTGATEYTTSTTGVTLTRTTNSPSTGFNRVALSGASFSVAATTKYFALAGLPSSGGVMRTFAGASGEWTNPASWSPSGVPTAIDQVVIGPSTVTISGNGQTFYASDILMNHAQATLQPNTNGVDGDEVTLVVNGDISMTAAGSEIKGVNGTGRLNIQIGDGVTAGVSSTISTLQNYNGNAGFSANDLIVSGAALDFAGDDQVRIYGDIQLVGNSSVDGSGADVVFYGGSNATQNLNVAGSAFLSMNKVITENNANVATNDFIEITDQILVKANTDFRMSGGTASFPPTASANAWTVESGGDLYLWNVELSTDNIAVIYTPSGTAYIQGDFTKSGASIFEPLSGTVVFANTGLRDLVRTGGELNFWNIEVQAGSAVRTSSDFSILNNIDVKNNASFVCNSGTVIIGDGTTGGNAVLDGLSEIMNVSTQTLEFFNLIIDQPTQTSDSWKVKGDFTLNVANTFEALDGTITFQNTQQKTITNSAANSSDLTFFGVAVEANSNVTSPSNYTIANNSTNMDGAGLTTLSNGKFYHTGELTFDAGVGVTAGNPKTITKSTLGTIEITDFTLAASPNNEVTTATDFTITNQFVNSGAGGNFNATGGTVIFNTGGTSAIESYSPAVTSFYGVTSSGTTQLTVYTAHEIFIKGDLTVNDATSFSPEAPTSKVIFNGTTQQVIGGNSSLPDFIEFGRLQINKGSGTTTTADEVLMEAPVLITGAGSQLVLTNGVLNLGSETLTNGAVTISRLNGVINGGTGTYIVASGHESPLLSDDYFTVDGTPTLYSLTVDLLHTTAGDLTVNGALVLGSGNLVVGNGGSAANAIQLNLLGNVSRVTGVFGGSNANSTILFGGTGTVSGGLSNTYFVGSTSTANLVFNRAETLGGNLTITAATDLEVGTGVNSLNLGANTLTFAANSTITMVSGGITAGIGSSVVFPASITEIPASMFRNNAVNNVTFAADMTLLGDLTINGIWSGAFDVKTGDNVLTIGENATLPALAVGAHVIGNLQRTVTATPTVFSVGNGTDYIPLSLQFATAGSEQLVTVSPSLVDPTIGRGGNPTNAVNAVWNISQTGTTPLDSLKAIFTWNANVEAAAGGGQIVSAGSFPAKWNGVNWTDYRNNVASVNTTTYVLTQSSSPIMASNLSGPWAIFNPDANTNAAKDAAIAVTSDKLVVTNVTPTPVGISEAFNVTVQLQDQYGQPKQATETFEVRLNLHQGASTFAPTTNVILAGETSVTFNGLTLDAAGANHQLLADTTGGSSRWQPGLSEAFTVLAVQPGTNASGIKFEEVNTTSIRITATAAGNVIVVVKANSLLDADEYPIDGTTYIGNSIYGAGSNLGAGAVVYNGVNTGLASPGLTVTGLAPNTTYYFYVFQYGGTDGTENYKTTAAAQNPNSTTTLGGTDDDVAFGSNGSFTTSKTIGTNTPVIGLITDASDEDWFNFTVTSASPNLRTQLSNLPANYNIEVYDLAGNLIRRGIRMSNGTESPVVNNLPAGTYVVRIYGYNGAFDATRTYTLQVTTRGEEIFSVTP